MEARRLAVTEYHQALLIKVNFTDSSVVNFWTTEAMDPRYIGEVELRDNREQLLAICRASISRGRPAKISVDCKPPTTKKLLVEYLQTAVGYLKEVTREAVKKQPVSYEIGVIEQFLINADTLVLRISK